MRVRNRSNEFISKVFGWMFIGMILSAVSAYVAASDPTIMSFLTSGIIFWILIIAELVMVIVLVAAINKLSPEAATGLFILYAITTGLTISVILLIYSI